MKIRLLLSLAALVAVSTTTGGQTEKTPPPPAVADSAALDSPTALPALRERLLAATTKHLDLLSASPDRLTSLKGKSAAVMTALAFYRMFETTGKPAYRTAALRLADGILAEMKATKFGVLFVKEKEKGADGEIDGGGPPALGWYATALVHIYQHEGRSADLKYVASVLDGFPWNEQGWWAATIDIRTGEPKLPLSKPSPVNKSAALVLAAGLAGEAVRDIDPPLADRLRKKAARCIQSQILPAQEADGFWHYNLNGRDPKNKDVLGYFMLTAGVLLELQQLAPVYRDAPLDAALAKAGAFARTDIAPMTEPNRATSPRRHATAGTPARFTLAEDLKRAFQLGVVLLGTKNYDAALPLIDAALAHFPFGNRGDDGAHAVYSTALLYSLSAPPASPLRRE